MASKQKLAEKLLAEREFPVPGELVDLQLDRNIERTLGQLLEQGNSPADPGGLEEGS